MGIQALIFDQGAVFISLQIFSVYQDIFPSREFRTGFIYGEFQTAAGAFLFTGLAATD